MHSNTTATTLARIEAVKGFYEAGMTAKAIAEKLSGLEGKFVSRMAVIGIYNRNRDELAGCPLPPSGRDLSNLKTKKQKLTPPVAVPKRRPRGQTPKPKPSNVIPFIIPETAFTYEATHPTKKLWELAAIECRWPMTGGGAETDFCSQHRSADSSYCEHHRRLSIGPGTKWERRAEETLRKLA